MNRTHVLTDRDPTAVASSGRRASSSERTRVEVRQRQGKALVVAGWISAVVGVVLYCIASFATQGEADLGGIVLHGTVPAARAALVIVAGGTLLWIVGSVMHVNAVLDAAEAEGSASEREHR